MVVDSHQHFWITQREDYGFLQPDAGVLYRNYQPNDLRPVIVNRGIDATIAIQAAQTVEETLWLLDLVRDVKFVLGVVGWLNFLTPEREFLQALRDFQANKKFVGLRPMLQDIPDDQWILQPQVLANLQIVADEGLPFDILVYPRHLPFVLEAIDRMPHLRAVVDHLAKPPIRIGELEPWASNVAALSCYPDIWCKISGMVTEANWSDWKVSDFVPYVRHVLDAFGPERVMFGSDWPVCLQAATYDQVYQLAEATIPKETLSRYRDAIFGENALRFYRLNGSR